MKPIRFAISASLLSVILAAVCLIPIPHYVYCNLYVQAQGAANVYVDQEGTIESIHIKPNTKVEPGQPIITLASFKLKGQIAALQTQFDMAKVEEQNLMAATAVDPTASSRIGQIEAAVKSASMSLAKRSEDLKRLEIRVPLGGQFLPPPRVAEKKTDSGELGTWNDTPLNPKNVGAFMEKQTLVGQIVPDLSQMEAVLAIDQADLEFVGENQSVEMVIDGVPAERFVSKTVTVSPTKMKSVPKALSSRHGGEIVVSVDKDGVEVPQSTTFLIKVSLDNPDQTLLPGNTGTAKISAGSRTIAGRIWRVLNKTFQFDL